MADRGLFPPEQEDSAGVGGGAAGSRGGGGTTRGETGKPGEIRDKWFDNVDEGLRDCAVSSPNPQLFRNFFVQR